MTGDDLKAIYRSYIDCLNAQNWERLGEFVHPKAEYNGEEIGLGGYRAMLEADFRAIPDLYFNIVMLVSEPPRIASRLQFDCHPAGDLFGCAVNGARVRFAENVFYRFEDGLIRDVRSVIDKAAIAEQIDRGMPDAP